jgi:hypothetical protein
LPASATRVAEALAVEGLRLSDWGDLAGFARAAVRAGREPPFRVVVIAGHHVAVQPALVSAARMVYTLASRATRYWGAVSVAAVAEQLRAARSVQPSPIFVRRVVDALPCLEWLDAEDGWFWCPGRPNRVVENIKTIVSAVAVVPLPKLWQALRKGRIGSEPPPLPVLGRICGTIGGLTVENGDVVSDSVAVPASALNGSERLLAMILATAGRPLRAPEIVHDMAAEGVGAAAVHRLLATSAFVERSARGAYALIGAAPRDGLRPRTVRPLFLSVA